MRYLLIFLAVLGGAVYAQPPLPHFSVGTEKFQYFDTSLLLQHLPVASFRDSFRRMQVAAEGSGDIELAMSIKLYMVIREAGTHMLSTDSAEYRLLKLADDAGEKNMKRLEADAIQALGELYMAHKQQSAAIEQYLIAYNIYKGFGLKDFPDRQYYVYRLGLAYYKYEDYKNAIAYLKEALYLDPSSGQYGPIANTIGLAYRNMKAYDSAVFYFRRVADTAIARSEPVWVGISQGNIGIVYYEQKRYAEAEPLLKKDIESGLAHSSIKNTVNSMVVLATIYCEQGRNDEAAKLLLDALSYCHKRSFWSDYTLAERIYGLLYRVYGLKKEYRLAYLYADSALMAKDTAIAQSNALVLSQSYERQNFIKKKLANERLQNQAKLDQIKKFDQQQLLYKFIIGFLIVVFIVVIIVNRNRNRLKNIATSIQDAPEIVVQKMSIVYISIATCVAALVWAGLYYYYYGFCLITVLPFVYFLLVAPSLIIYFLTKKHLVLVITQLFCIFFVPLALEVTCGGFKGGVVILWSFMAPIGALMYQGIRQAALWMATFILTIICLAVFHDFFTGFFRPIPETARFMFDCMNILGPLIVIYFSMQFFVRSVIRDGKLLQENNLTLSNTLGELKAEKQKSDDLLLNILPEEVADELKAKGTTTAKQFDNVTVLFTDFVNFTRAGEQMDPQQLVDELDACFKAFDEITGRYNIEKIKTVGDAYLATAGLPTADPHHAENVVRAAIAIARFMKERMVSSGGNTFDIRIGVHSGPVVAGVVGVKKFAYDIWGDTVNTAARMEQNSEPGKINISETTYELVKDMFSFTSRGQIDVKGKGWLKMYFVDGAA